MIKSMTGFGKSEAQLAGKVITVEVKSLNSKQADISLRIPNQYKSKEIELRNLLSQTLNRGKIDFSMYSESAGDNTSVKINKDLALSYYAQIKQLEPSLGDQLSVEMISMLLRMPDVMNTDKAELDESEWVHIHKAALAAIANMDEHRVSEGKNLETELLKNIQNISDHLLKITELDKVRMAKIRERLEKAVSEMKEGMVDKNRFEQELIFYIEKLDINEEKVRLKIHLDYFLQTIKDEQYPGKKLGFIGQEIGREINTIGSKSNDADMQKLVVQMKDELEKIKEQSLNVL
ncbi:MAG: YicC family protein [Bacteroidetes bacterium]|nr:YicC family protein [Bacteroidota bacterium]